MINLKKLILKNFKSYEEQTIEFTIGRNVIHGNNGAGKTSILLAILYALLGRVQRLGKTVLKEELVRKGVNSFTVELEFEIEEVNYIVRRTNYIDNREPIAKLWRGSDSAEEAELIAEGQKAVTNEIKDLLGIDFTTFENVVYIGQGEIPLIATEQARWRKDIFDQFLNLDIYEKVVGKFGEIKKTNDGNIENLTMRIHDLEIDTNNLPAEEKNLLESQDRLEKRKEEELEYDSKFKNIQIEFNEEDEKRISIDLLEKSLNEKLKQIKNIDTNIYKKQIEIEKVIEQELCLEEPELKKLMELHNELKENFEEKQKEYGNLIKTQEKLESELNSIEKRIEDNENSQKSSQNIIEKNKKEIVDQSPELEKMDDSEWRSSVSSKIEDLNKKLEGLKAERDLIRGREKDYTVLTTKLRAKEEILEKGKSDLSKAESKIVKLDSNWEEDFKEYSVINFDENFEKQEQEFNELNLEFTSLTNQRAVLNSQITEKKNEFEQIESLKEGVKCPQCKQTVTSEHKTQIIEELKTQIENFQLEIGNVESQLKEKEIQINEYNAKKQELEKKSKLFQKLKPLEENIRKLKEQNEIDNKEFQQINSEIESIVIEKPSNQYENEISIENENGQIYSNIIIKIDSNENTAKALEDLIIKNKEFNVKKQEILETYEPETLGKTKIDLEKVNIALKDEQMVIPSLSNIIERVNEKTFCCTESEDIRSELEEKGAQFDPKRYQEVIKTKDEISQKIGEIKNDIETLQKKSIPDLNTRIENLRKKSEELEQKKLNLQKKKKISSLIKIIREFSREIVPILRHQKTTQISAKASEIFLDLVGESGEFDGITVTENYDLYVRRYGTDEDITMLSGGEQVVSCLAIRLAIAEILANQGLILLDEPTSHLDEKHVKDLVEVFELYSPARQIITVTHDNEFEKIADSLIQVYKENGISQIL